VCQLDGLGQCRPGELSVAAVPGCLRRYHDRLKLIGESLLGGLQKLSAGIDRFADVPSPEPDRYERPEADPVEGLPPRGLGPQG
jgi:hypothetical protein